MPHTDEVWAPLPADATLYAQAGLAQLPRLLSLLDREPDSASHGSFDRSFWAWKFRDCPVTMAQAAVVPLAQVWSVPLSDNPYFHNARLLSWISSSLQQTCRLQNDNGSFNVWGPHTDHPGVALAMALVACRTIELLEGGLDSALTARLHRMVERACAFGLQCQEDYAFISNHQAHMALALLRSGELLGRAAYRQRAERIIAQILEAQSPDGWYAEYGGPDPGYESLGISYLATYWQRTRSAALLDSLRRSVEFYAYCVHPDGSVGGAYGSRHTLQFYPAGFEILSGKIPLAAAVARFLRERLARRNVITLPVVDAENLAVLAGNYLDACRAAAPPPAGALPPLPCEALDGVKHFPQSGVTVAGSPRYYAVLSAAKGGVCRVFDKPSATLAYEDSGYVVRAGKKTWTSQRLSPEKLRCQAQPDEALCSASFTAVRPVAVTPARFLLFRLASMTLVRNVRLGAWLRRQIVERLITASRKGPLRLERRVRFAADEIEFSDHIEIERPAAVNSVELVRSFTSIHMGSARYFHPADLVETPLPDTRSLAHDLAAGRAANCTFRLRFSATSKPELLSGAGTKSTETTQPVGMLTRR